MTGAQSGFTSSGAQAPTWPAVHAARLDLLEDSRRDDRLGDRCEEADRVAADPRGVGRGHGLEPGDAVGARDAEDHERCHAPLHL